MKQREFISPLLFSLFIEDLELFLQEEQNCGLRLDDTTFLLMLFADDMVMLGKGINDLQNSLELLERYCDRLGLQINTEKN